MAKITSRYVPDNGSMARFLLSGRVGEVALDAADDISRDAAANAARHSRTGRLARSFRVRPWLGGEQMEGGPRLTAIVYNLDPAAIANEVGNKRTPARRNLTRAALRYHVPKRVRR